MEMTSHLRIWVYPRVCGGTTHGASSGSPKARVYPRVCGGTHTACASLARPPRSIPACAGEPYELLRPQTRQLTRSIPACAGEPASSLPRGSNASAVYPRVCGGTRQGNGLRASMGLSPRVRGKVAGCSACDHASRSIPACAGEPTSRTAAVPCVRLPAGLSPRVRGNPESRAVGCLPSLGLSPRVRGNPMASLPSAVLNHSGLSPRVRGNLS